MPHTKVYVQAPVPCDLCQEAGITGSTAYADARIPGMGWANVCKSHFAINNCTLGLGCGQEFVIGEAPEPKYDAAVMMAADILGCHPSEVE